ncbi:small ribosomal subunit protein mS22 [Stomoxys calcitrans]|uniref:28S ribosomal protein S22, mitochondrial n=1 Tax=Stomoxys calcitrans TaxID=35570 RepID=A0A1I8PB53_STOCA|nr:small ribosomal subunit protein mS22 [Stomoxys calcitrans]
MHAVKQRHLLNSLRTLVLKTSVRNTSIKGVTLEYDKDPHPLFTDAETQKLLKSLTQLQVEKVFRKATMPKNTTEYKFMTTEELEEEFVKTIERAKSRLQMPPVVKVKEDTPRVISEDKALKGFSDTKYVITDISFGLKPIERKVVVRETDGTLRYAPMDVTKRMKQLYAPLAGRKIRTPKMFEDEHFQRCLDEHKYEFILDRLVVQYEPYETEYHRLCSKVYQHLNDTKEFDQLRSTRHFGPMAFFYAWHKCIDDLLYDMIRRDYLRNGAELIALYYKIHKVPENYSVLLQKLEQYTSADDIALKALRTPLKKALESGDIHDEIESAIGKSARDFEMDELCLQFIESFISSHALKKVQLELAVQTLKEINAEKKQLYEGLSKAHGVQQSN